ncbi:hypothetical protein SEVIR_9G523900v4 [Setaria viridis]
MGLPGLRHRGRSRKLPTAEGAGGSYGGVASRDAEEDSRGGGRQRGRPRKLPTAEGADGSGGGVAGCGRSWPRRGPAGAAAAWPAFLGKMAGGWQGGRSRPSEGGEPVEGGGRRTGPAADAVDGAGVRGIGKNRMTCRRSASKTA